MAKQTTNNVLERATFEVSRELEFFSEKELTMQIGHRREWWSVALLKELIDNALDACETAGIPPEIDATFDDDGFSVRDNGPGLPAETITGSLDYLKRVSDKTFYVSPTRGQLGNALKVLWAAPLVVNGERGLVEVGNRGQHHTIEVSVDRLAQRPRVEHSATEDAVVKNGTFVNVHWSDLSCSEDEFSYIEIPRPMPAQELIEAYAAFNPHATFRFRDMTFDPTSPAWEKWKPCDPTSPHWYSPETLRDLIAAYVSHENGSEKTVREFVSEFRGLSATAKQKQIGRSGVYLRDLVRNGDLDTGEIEALLSDMKQLSKPPKPAALGVIGEDHLAMWMVRCADVSEESIRYNKRMGIDPGGLPFVLEIAFGIRDEGNRRIVTGLNWSPTLGMPISESSSLIQKMRIDPHDPVTVVLHIARPRFEFTDHGKTRLQL